MSNDLAPDALEQVVDRLVAPVDGLADFLCRDLPADHLVGADEHPLGVIEHLGEFREGPIQHVAAFES